jgi:hypothetical protein
MTATCYVPGVTKAKPNPLTESERVTARALAAHREKAQRDVELARARLSDAEQRVQHWIGQMGEAHPDVHRLPAILAAALTAPESGEVPHRTVISRVLRVEKARRTGVLPRHIGIEASLRKLREMTKGGDNA